MLFESFSTSFSVASWPSSRRFECVFRSKLLQELLLQSTSFSAMSFEAVLCEKILQKSNFSNFGVGS